VSVSVCVVYVLCRQRPYDRPIAPVQFYEMLEKGSKVWQKNFPEKAKAQSGLQHLKHARAKPQRKRQAQIGG
jgi:hypothetical protein